MSFILRLGLAEAVVNAGAVGRNRRSCMSGTSSVVQRTFRPEVEAAAVCRRCRDRTRVHECDGAQSGLRRGLEPSRFGKLRVAWRMLSALLAGVSPAPKHGPQKAVFTMAPVAMRSAMAPFASQVHKHRL